MELECLLHTVDISRSVVIAHDRLRSLSDSLKRQHCKLHRTCEDRHGTDRQISAVF